jgi:hypothetical protein
MNWLNFALGTIAIFAGIIIAAFIIVFARLLKETLR